MDWPCERQRKLGKSNIVLRGDITKANTTVSRYARATLAQKLGVETRDAWHKTDWEAVKKNPKILEMPRPDWLFGHDPQEYAYEEFATAALAVLTGADDYVPRNVPPKGQSHRTGDFSGKKMKAWKATHPAAKL